MALKIRTLGLQFKEGLKGLWRNRMMSLASIGSVTAVLLVLGLSLVIIINVNNITKYVESSVEIKAFLFDGLSESQIKTISDSIKGMEGIREVTYESKEEALEKWQAQLGNKGDLLTGLEGDDNPLPSSYIVKVEDPTVIAQTAERIATLEGVEEVRYGKDIVDSLIQSTKAVRVVGIVLIVVLALISIFIISNTIKLTVVARRKEISIMKLVGATDGFIRLPFIIEGLCLGFVGSLLASGTLAAIYNYFFTLVSRNYASFFALVSASLAPVGQTVYSTSMVLSAIGVLIGAIGSVISLRRFLNA
jgi:cell division transport system permease protein